MSTAKNIDISSRLLEKKVVSEDQLEIALREQNRLGGKKTIGAILVDMGFVSEAALGEVLNESGVKPFDIKSSIIDPRLVKKVPKSFSVQNKLIPVLHSKGSITIGMADVFDIIAIDKVKKYFPPNFIIQPVYIAEIDIMHAIDQYHDYEMSIEGILKEIEGGDADITNEDQLHGDYRSPMVRLVDAIFTDAVHKGASDLHFEPENLFLRIRYRIDGEMMQIRSVHKDYWSAIAVRIKILSGMNIAETRRSQDGRINAEILGRKIDFRVSSYPTIHGENIVLRILDEKQSILALETLGFTDDSINLLKKLVQRPEGIIILTGPTGSGKTTTLYTMLTYINSIDKNIMTLEDPVEYHIPLIRQSNIRTDIGMDFASGIRSILRQDPDVILIGEIRDKETAIAAVQAAMTGHQVYSSLHTNDAISAIPRLINLGIPSYLLVGSLICVVAQRLAKRLCSHCKIEKPISAYEKKILGAKYQNVEKLFSPKGCEKCHNTGYKGRVVISEIISIDSELDELIANSATKKEIVNYLLTNGFIPMADDGLAKVVQGTTDLEELIKVVDMTSRMT